MLLVAPTNLLRLMFGSVILIILTIWTATVCIGINPEKIDPYRLSLIRWMGQWVCRGILLASGIYWINVEYMEDADYKKWLGPDWKPQWKGCGTMIQNHINGYCDVLSSMYLFYPAFVSNKVVKKYPFVGLIAIAMDCIFLDRAGCREDKVRAIK